MNRNSKWEKGVNVCVHSVAGFIYFDFTMSGKVVSD